MAGDKDWGRRSSQDEPTSTSWGEQNVFDLFSKTMDKASDGSPYSDWLCVSQIGRNVVKLRRELQRGFTLIELMVVMAMISVLLAIALPIYQKSIDGAKESVLRNNLFTLRIMIDEYTINNQKAPETLQDLVSEGQLRQIPRDPITGSDQTWKLIMEDAPIVGNNNPSGIFDVRSGSDKTGLDGTQYADW